MIRHSAFRAANRVLMAFAWMLCTACSPDALTSKSATLQARTILVLLDLSGSMPPARHDGPLQRLASEARPDDRLVILPLTDRTSEPPLLDTVLAGGVFGRISSQFQLATRESRRLELAEQTRFAIRLQQLTRSAYRSRESSRGTAIIDAVCEAATSAVEHPAEQVTILVLTDGLESSAWARLESHAPALRSAVSLAARVRSVRPCPLDAANLRLRMVGLRHPVDTPSLGRWWAALTAALGYRARPEDISAHPLGPLLGTTVSVASPVRDPGRRRPITFVDEALT